MAVRSLQTLRTLFYLKSGLTETQVPEEGAQEFLNLGFEMLSQDTGGLHALIKTDLVADQEDYTLPDYVIKVHEAQVYNSSGDRLKTLTKLDPRYLQRKTGEMDSGVPYRFSFTPSQMKDGDRGRPILRIQPASSSNITDGLWIYVLRVPDRKTDNASQPDLGDSAAQMAAVAAACWYAVSDPNRKMMLWDEYSKLKAIYNRSRGTRMPVFVYRPGFNSV